MTASRDLHLDLGLLNHPSLLPKKELKLPSPARIRRWSKLYDLPERTLAQLCGLSKENSYDGETNIAYELRGRTDLAYTIVRRNSQLVQEFLAVLPGPKPQQPGAKPALHVDFIYPSGRGWHQVWEGEFHPFHAFEQTKEVASIYVRSDGLEFVLQAGPDETDQERQKKQQNDIKQDQEKLTLGTYVEALGVWNEGYRKVVQEWIPFLLEHKFFINSFSLGTVYQEKDSTDKLKHGLGVGSVVGGYECSDGPYNMSAKLWYDPEEGRFWHTRQEKEIRRQVRKLNETFLRIK